jgi:hypothetical protein
MASYKTMLTIFSMYSYKEAAEPTKISMVTLFCKLPEDIEYLETTVRTQTLTCPCASSSPV